VAKCREENAIKENKELRILDKGEKDILLDTKKKLLPKEKSFCETRGANSPENRENSNGKQLRKAIRECLTSGKKSSHNLNG